MKTCFWLEFYQTMYKPRLVLSQGLLSEIPAPEVRVHCEPAAFPSAAGIRIKELVAEPHMSK